MKTINYTAKVLPDGHISLPYEIKGGIEYVEDIRSGWDKRTKRIDNV